MKIKYKLPLIIFLSVAIPIVIVGFIFYFSTASFSSDVYDEALVNASNNQSLIFTANFDTYKQSSDDLSEQSTVQSVMEMHSAIFSKDKETELNALRVETGIIFAYRKANLDALDEVYLISKNGNVLASSSISTQKYLYVQKDIYDITEPILVTDGRIKDDGTSAPSREDANYIFSVAPVTVNFKTVGMIIQKYNTNLTSAAFNAENSRKDQFSFVINKAGYIISGSDEALSSYVSSLVENNIESELTNLVNKYKNNELTETTGVITFKYNGENMRTCYTINNDVDWIICTAMAESAINDVAVSATLTAALILILISIIILIFGYIFSKTITGPIELLKTQFVAASHGDYSVSLPTLSKDEFGELGASFNEMIKNVDNAFKSLVAAEDSIKEQKSKYELILNNSKDCLCEWNIATGEFYANNKWTPITGRPVPEVVDVNYLSHLPSNPDDSAKLKDSLSQLLAGKIESFSETFQSTRGEDRQPVWLYFRGALTKNTTTNSYVIIATLSDITELKSTQALVEELSVVDHMTHLTNLANITKSIEEHIKENNTASAVIMIGINNLASINERFGFNAGNTVIKEQAEKLRSLTSPNILLAKGDGDTFVLFIKEFKTEAEIDMLATTAISLSDISLHFEGNLIASTSCAGAALCPKDARNANELLKCANIALNYVKSEKQDDYLTFSPSMLEDSVRKAKIADLLQTCIEDDALSVYLQPEYNIKTGEIRCFEALLKLKDNAELGYISPAEFIPIAEKTGHIIKITNWLIEHICIKVCEMKDAGYKFGSISVNISLAHALREDFFPTIRRIIRSTGVNTKHIDFEITESILMGSFEKGKQIITKLRDMGIRVVLDDFGSGYSSLNYLRELTIDTLKIDKEFITNICRNENDVYIVETIINLAHKMGMDVVAEGIETEEQLNILKSLDCDIIQGYYFSRPIPEDDVKFLPNIL